ncbi:GNAT family N-acetyltransferase [Muricomes intestini]|jgi:phosphinothricin acetyltransferase|uniref:Phosphinothricin acetyltransferase n=1 Tax=Muricomes intestini TaxID=1796634 RepID=A0A4R3K7C6_9FIRM|nr:GNAT family N-acetyltransferase [Muricomes intestini]TCS78844.1 phosphinothricin acetyltransferase [Muricomes intestini]HCR82631.1 GNAT family N-acetyltransferase [Lachnospiraceae bacterium]
MKLDEIMIRMASLKDARGILDIYAPYVTDSANSFEYEVPHLRKFRRRMLGIMEKFPYLVAEEKGKIIGYCYACSFKDRAAYDWSVETTIYIGQGYKSRGIGRKLYQKLEEILVEQHILNLNACITYPNPESIAFHEKMGYETAAHFHRCGYKAGMWYDMIWMEKMLGRHETAPLPVIPVSSVDIDRTEYR